METMESKQVAVSYKAADLKQVAIKSLIVVTTKIKEKNYLLLVDGTETALDAFNLITLHTKDLEGAIMLASKKIKKSLLNRSRGLEKGVTLKKANTLIHFIRTKLLKDIQPVASYKFSISKKEEEIQASRKVWLGLRDETEKTLILYKETKGNFYKGTGGN